MNQNRNEKMKSAFNECMDKYAEREMDGVEFVKTAKLLKGKILSPGTEGTDRLAAYEELAFLLSMKRDKGAVYPKIDIGGLDIAMLMDTETVWIQSKARCDFARLIEERLRKMLKDLPRMNPEEAREQYEKSGMIGLGLDWNIDFNEHDLSEIGKKGFTGLAEIFTKMPAGINISKAQAECGIRFCLAGVDASEAIMDRRDYYSLPVDWRPKAMPKFLHCKNIVKPAVAVDRDLLEMAGAVFSSIRPAPGMEQLKQLQTALTRELVIGRRQPMKAVMEVMVKAGRNLELLPGLYNKSRAELAAYRGETPASHGYATA